MGRGTGTDGQTDRRRRRLTNCAVNGLLENEGRDVFCQKERGPGGREESCPASQVLSLELPAAASLTSGPNQPRIPKSAMGAGRGKELPHIFYFPSAYGGTSFQGSLPGRFSSRDELHIADPELDMCVLDHLLSPPEKSSLPSQDVRPSRQTEDDVHAPTRSRTHTQACPVPTPRAILEPSCISTGRSHILGGL